MTDVADMLSLAQELAEVTRLVEDDNVSTALDRFVHRVTRTVPDCNRALVVVRSRGLVEAVAGKDDMDLTLAGPVVEAVTFGEPRRLDNVATDQRWPEFSARIARFGLCSCLCLPLVVRGESTAVLVLLSNRPDAFGEASFDLVLLLTLHAGVVFDNVNLYRDSGQLVEQLRTALQTRTTVGQAQGLLMHRFGYDPDRAFSALKTASQNSNTKLRDVATLMVRAHEVGGLEDVLQKLALTAAGESV